MKIPMLKPRLAPATRKPWAPAANAPSRLRGYSNQKRRRRILAAHPLCVMCETVERVTAATVLDHIVPLSRGGPDSDANLQPLCDACHQAKTRAEQRRGE
jgi:5-methylcytosine-specific restriction protein A